MVTFERTDPLFVINMSDGQNPKIMWQLKIPGYSTYLHPYDDNHLIWIGYDTSENDWGWIINTWVKVDLYQVNYDKQCWDEDLTVEEKEKCDSWEYEWIIIKQLATETFWWYRSYSEALYNPRMFMWKATENKLFLPIQIYESKEDEIYQTKDFYQWLLTISIDPETWISEQSRLTHIDTTDIEKEREEECSKYTPESLEKKCVELIWWWEYCESAKYSYVPEYCYATSTIGEYLASKSWNYRDSYIKRALWVWDNVYSISNSKITISDMDSGEIKTTWDLK